jgi:DNA-binding MarR family transcriptional regulator
MTRAEQINAAIRAIAFAQRATADAWVAGSGLTRQQAFTLGYIEEHQDRGVNARELSEMSGTTPASVASLLQGLEDRGLITRTPSPDDSRVKLIAVTDEASALVVGFDDQMRAAQERFFSTLTTDEQTQLLGLLDRVVTDLGVDIPAEPPRRTPRQRKS